MKGLGQPHDGAHLARSLLLLTTCGQQQRRWGIASVLGAKLVEHHFAVHSWHGVVEHEQSRLVQTCCLKRRRSIGSFDDRMPLAAQDASQRTTQYGVVIHNENRFAVVVQKLASSSRRNWHASRFVSSGFRMSGQAEFETVEVLVSRMSRSF